MQFVETKKRRISMKSKVAAGIAVLSLGAFALSASALDVGGIAEKGAKDAGKAGGRAAVESEINKNLKEKNCSFVQESMETTCNIDDILSTLKTQKSIAENAGLANDVDIYVVVGRGNEKKKPNLGSDRMALIREKLIKKISWWDWYDRMQDGDKLELSVKVQ
jgi:hypothetical protein